MHLQKHVNTWDPRNIDVLLTTVWRPQPLACWFTQGCSALLLNFLFNFDWKIMVWGAPEGKYCMEMSQEWLRSDLRIIGSWSGTMFQSNSEYFQHFCWYKLQKWHKKQNLIFKSQRLVMNPGQGPHLKCAPGHSSLEDSNIIKSHWHGRGVMDSEKLESAFWRFLDWAPSTFPPTEKIPGYFSVGAALKLKFG